MGDFLYECFGVFLGVLFFILICRACCRKRTNEGTVITTPVVITSEVHRVAGAGSRAAPMGVVVQGHTTGTAVYPPMQPTYPAAAASFPPLPAPYGGQQPYPAQPYPVVQQFPAHSAAPPPPQEASFPPLPPTIQPPVIGAAMNPSTGLPMGNPPSYDQAMTNMYAPQAPYNPDFKGH